MIAKESNGSDKCRTQPIFLPPAESESQHNRRVRRVILHNAKRQMREYCTSSCTTTSVSLQCAKSIHDHVGDVVVNTGASRWMAGGLCPLIAVCPLIGVGATGGTLRKPHTGTGTIRNVKPYVKPSVLGQATNNRSMPCRLQFQSGSKWHEFGVRGGKHVFG